MLIQLLLALGMAARAADPPVSGGRLSVPARWGLGWAADNPDVVLAVSDASGLPQLYAYELRRGRSNQLTDEPGGRRWGDLSPDGAWVLYVRDAIGGGVGQLFRAKVKGGKPEPLVPGFPAKAISDALWGASGRNVYFVAADQAGYGVYQYTLGARRAFTLYFSTREIRGLLPSRDERYAAFLLSAGSRGGEMDLRVVDLRCGGVAASLAIAPGSDESLGAWAPEGAKGRLLVGTDASGRRLPGLWDVALDTVTWLDPGLEGDVEALDWFPDGALLLRRTHGGATTLWRYDPASGAPAAAVDGLSGLVAWARVRPDGAVWANLESGERPPDLRAAGPGGEASPPLPAPGGRKRPPPPHGHKARLERFASTDGTALTGWLVVPSGAAASGQRAALLWLHGGPGGFSGDAWDPARLAAADLGVVTLALNYRGSRGLGRRGEAAPWGEPGTPELDDLTAARDWLVREQGVASSSVAVAGAHFGGTLALLALARQPELWAGGFAMGPIADWGAAFEQGGEPLRAWCRSLLGADPEAAPSLYAERSPLAHVFTIRAPLALAHAEEDPRSPAGQIEAFVARLKDAGKAHRFVSAKGAPSSLRVEDQERFLEAFLNLLHQAGLAAKPR
ncbi:MAG: S9 family peptidase [Elusimicrobia bacterium]|nr:S9 family peptidase [Elusimicrobiota bacterium]